MLNLLWSVGAFLVAIGVLVSVHEFGHFWAARRVGVKVLRFSVGFGRPLWRRVDRHGTEFVIAALPLGGYVKMLDETEAPVPADQLAQAFNRKPVWARMAVVAAGPLANLLLAWLLYWAMFMVGIYGQRPVVGQVLPDTPAAGAGFQRGDELRAVDGRSVRTWEDAVLALLPAAIDGRQVAVQVQPADTQGSGQARLLDLSGLDLPGRGSGRHAPPGPCLARATGRARGSATWWPAAPRRRPASASAICCWPPMASRLPTGATGCRRCARSPQQPLRLRLRRAGTELELTLTPQAVDDGGTRIGRVGLAPQPVSARVRRLLPAPALRTAGQRRRGAAASCAT